MGFGVISDANSDANSDPRHSPKKESEKKALCLHRPFRTFSDAQLFEAVS